MTEAQFLILFPEFKSCENGAIVAYLSIAAMRVPPSVWGAAAPYATALLTAHMLTSSGRQNQGAGGGAVSQETVGDLSRSFAQVYEIGSGDSALMTTRYGIDYVALRNETLASATVAVTPGQYPNYFNDDCW